MGTFPADVARCSGVELPDGSFRPDCLDCLRRTDRTDFPLLVWVAAQDAPCPIRIAPPFEVDKGDAADAKRLRWLLDGNGYFLEENHLCGHGPCSEIEQDEARMVIDRVMREGY